MATPPGQGQLKTSSPPWRQVWSFFFENFDGKIDDRIREAVNQAMEAAMERANAVSKQINDLKSEVGALRFQLVDAIKALQDAVDGRGGDGQGVGTTNGRNSGGASSASDADTTLQIGKKKNMLAWKAHMKFNSEWNGQQRTNYNRLLKVRDPNEHKR